VRTEGAVGKAKLNKPLLHTLPIGEFSWRLVREKLDYITAPASLRQETYELK
jgi:hypothetical protein